MKAEELMIGDWFSFNGKAGQIGIIDNWDGEVSYFNGDAEGILTFGFDDIEPIPLTAEILEKNGFERNEHFDYNGCIFFSFPTGIFTKRSGFGIEKKDDKYYITDHALMPMRYVHELQHALRLCGLNELANNFKI